MRLIRYLSFAGLLLFAIILSSADLKKTAQIIVSAKPTLLIAGLALVVAEVIVRSLSWKILADIWTKGYGYRNAFETYMIGIAFGSVTPAKAGDFIKVGDLSEKTGLTMTKAFTIGLLDRLLNFILLFLSACAGTVTVMMMMTGSAGILSMLLLPLAAALVALAVALNERASIVILKPLQSFLVPERFRGNTKEIFKTFHETLGEFKACPLKWAVLVLTFIGWVVIFVRPYFFAKAVGMDVGLWVFLAFLPIISVVEVLPISIMGLGTRDATIIFLFTLMGTERERMMALSAMMLLLSMVPQAAVGYFIAWSAKVRRK